MDWIRGSGHFSNWNLETDLAAPWHPLALLHTKWSQLPRFIKSSVLLRDTIVTWKEIRKLMQLPFSISKLMPLWGHPEFPLGVGPRKGVLLRHKGILVAGHLMHSDRGKWLKVEEIMHNFTLPASKFLEVAQLHHFCTSRLVDLSVEVTVNKFDELLQYTSQGHGISSLYSQLRRHLAKGDTKHIFKRWEQVLGDPFVADKILSGWGAVRKYIVCENWRETYYKLIHNAIYGFNLPARPQNTSRITACPKCDTPLTDMWHGFWTCPAIQRFWEEVGEFVNGLGSTRLELGTDLFIFHCVRPPESSSQPLTRATTQALPCAALLHIALIAAKRCITKMWLSPTIPTIQMLVTQIKTYLHLDRLFVERNPEIGAKGFFKKWKCFILQYLTNNEIEQIMLSFRHTRWYLTAQLAGTLGTLEIR